ncbi:MAG: hypothetical protein ACMXX7_00775 [Candidatus Woesearchaeota archaeon]
MKEINLEKTILEDDFKKFIDIFNKHTNWKYKHTEDDKTKRYEVKGVHTKYKNISFNLDYYETNKGTSYFFYIKEKDLLNKRILIKQKQKETTTNIIQIGENEISDYLMEAIVQELKEPYKKYLH